MIEKEIEKHNLEAIKRLNQRGGRMLSIVDLLEDGTVDRKLIEFLVRRLWAGDSILAAAGPSGTGKTTLMGALLNLIPPGTKIYTAERSHPINSPDSSALFMAHELNDAPYYGYIWGSDARKFLESAEGNQIAATLHARSLGETENKLSRKPINLNRENFNRIDLVIIMKKSRRSRDTLRRLEGIYGFTGTGHRRLFKWSSADDSYEDIRTNIYNEKRREELEGFDLDGFVDRLLTERPKRLKEVRGLLLEYVH